MRGADIAKELKLSKASVHRLMDFFEQAQYVKRGSGKHIVLTDDGKRKALEYEKYSMELNKRLFHSELCDNIEETAICYFLANLSEEKLACLFPKEAGI